MMENYLSLYGFTVQSLIIDGRLKEDEMTLLKIWLKRQPDLPKFTDETLAVFHLACKNNLEATKRCARNYYLSVKNAPELFSKRDMTRMDVQAQMRSLIFCIIPVRTEEGYVIIHHRLQDTNPSAYDMEVAMKVLFMVMDTAVYDNPPTGLKVLFDMKGVSLGHLPRLKLTAIKNFFFHVQEALPLQLISIHVLNVVWFFDKIFKLFKPFIKPEVIEQLHLHKCNINMDEFYEKHIPKKCLPSDYGGDLASIEELHIMTEKKLIEMNGYFYNEELVRKHM